MRNYFSSTICFNLYHGSVVCMLLAGQLLAAEQDTTSQAMQIKALQGNMVFS